MFNLTRAADTAPPAAITERGVWNEHEARITARHACPDHRLHERQQVPDPGRAPTFAPIKDWETVQVYAHADSVPGDYVELAHIEGKGDLFTSKTNVMKAMRQEAAEVGANAIIVLGYDRMGLGEGGGDFRQGRATAIRVFDLLLQECRHVRDVEGCRTEVERQREDALSVTAG